MPNDSIDDLFDQKQEEADAERWDWDENPTIKGILVGAIVLPGREYGPYYMLRIKEEQSGTTTAIPAFGTVLNNQVQDVAPKIGFPIGIRYNGMKSNKDGSREYKDWTVVSPESDFKAWAELNARKHGSNRPTITAPIADDGDDDDFF